jgi:hypothetical protein
VSSSGSGGLVGILKVLALLVLAYFAVTEGWPWLRDQFGLGGSRSVASEEGDAGGGEGEEGGGRCVALATRASEALGAEIRNFRQPPYDLDAWGAAVAGLEDRAAAAETACGCPAESCETATAALVELRELVAAVDGVIRGEATSFRNPARSQDRIDDLLDRARDLAREGR